MSLSRPSYWTVVGLFLAGAALPGTALARHETLEGVRLEVPHDWRPLVSSEGGRRWEIAPGGEGEGGVVQLLVDPTYLPLARWGSDALEDRLATSRGGPVGATPVEIAGLRGFRLALEEAGVHHVVYVLCGQETVILSLSVPGAENRALVERFDASVSTLQWTHPLTFAMPPWFCVALLGAGAGCGATLRRLLSLRRRRHAD